MTKKKGEKKKDTSDEKHDKEDNLDSVSVAKLAEALDVEDPEEKERLISTISRFSSSPVPPPKVLEGYDDIVEGGAKWLMEYTKEEQLHRHKMDRKELSYYSIGQILGFILGLIGIGGGIYLAATGVKWFGFAAFFASLVSLVGLFVYDKKMESQEESI